MRSLLRSALLSLSQSRNLERLARRYGPNLGASHFVAGETITEALDVVETLNRAGFGVILDHLGEFTSDVQATREAAAECTRAMEAIREANVSSQLSVKLTQLGLDIDPSLCQEHMRLILDKAQDTGNFVWIDMEDYHHCQATLDLFRVLRQEYDCVGCVIQSYLRRSSGDIALLAPLSPAIRIVKGAYQESSDVAFPNKPDVDAEYEQLVDQQLQSNGFTAIATHDDRLIQRILTTIQAKGIPANRYEFQMLYGIRQQLQEKLVNWGSPVRIYVPYGVDWYGYFMRRIAERPANAAFVLRNLFRH